MKKKQVACLIYLLLASIFFTIGCESDNSNIPEGIHTGTPPLKAQPHPVDSLPMVIGISASGQMICDDIPFEAAALSDQIRKHIQTAGKQGLWDLEILIAADSVAPFGAVALLITELRRMGHGKINLLFEGEVVQEGVRLWPVVTINMPSFSDEEELFLLRQQKREEKLMSPSMFDLPPPLSHVDSNVFKQFFLVYAAGNNQAKLGSEPALQPLSVIKDSLNMLMFSDSLFMKYGHKRNNVRPLLIMLPDNIPAYDAVLVLDAVKAIGYPKYIIETSWDEEIRKGLYHLGN